jgi:hypothetical protein
MLTTDFLALYKQITSDIYEYLMFLALTMIVYLFIGAMVKLITDCIIKIVLSIRAPITTKFETVEEEV